MVNPIYHLRSILAEWQAKRYKYNKERKALLELRLLQLNMKNSNTSDPKVQKEIEYIQSRVDDLGMYISSVEEDLKFEAV
jgi:hypothetical protein